MKIIKIKTYCWKLPYVVVGMTIGKYVPNPFLAFIFAFCHILYWILFLIGMVG